MITADSKMPMAAPNQVVRLVRESRWVKEYQTPTGRVLDSKYRTFRCNVTASQFVDAWNRGSEAERADMEAAFAFFPGNSEDDLNLGCTHGD
jgi:hypothetical protein